MACVVGVYEGRMPSTCPLGHPTATGRGGGTEGGERVRKMKAGMSCRSITLEQSFPLLCVTFADKVQVVPIILFIYIENSWSTTTRVISDSGCSIPAAVLVVSFTVELVGGEDCENALLRAEVLPLYTRVGLQVVCQHCNRERASENKEKEKYITKAEWGKWENM